MAYTRKDFKSGAELKRALKAGEKIEVYQPNGDITGATIPRNGTVFLEGPHYPKPHSWYLQGTMKDGFLEKVK